MALYMPSLMMEDYTGLENNFYLIISTIAIPPLKKKGKLHSNK